MPLYNKIQIRRGTTAEWTAADTALRYLSEGELGYDTSLKRFKIGQAGNTPWASLPWAGGSDLSPGSGIAVIKDDSTNTYTVYGTVSASGSGIISTSVSYGGNGTTTASGTYFSVALSDRLQSLASINTAGFLVSNSTTGTVARSLASGNNINITNPDGSGGNPILSLNSSLTGLSSVTSSNLTVSSQLAVSGALTLNGRNITTSIEAVPNTNTANFNLSVGSISNVGTNGGPSYYGTYDQGGNVREIMHSGSTSSVAMRGGNFANLVDSDALNKSVRNSQTPTAEGPGFGFRLSSRENIGKSYPLTLTVGAATGIATSGSVIHGFQIGDPLKFANDLGLPGGLSSGVTYYVVGTGSTTFSVSLSAEGSAVSVTGAGTGTTSTYSAYDYGSFVRVENSGNTADSTTYGAVSYNYRIGKFEITNDEYVEFLNAVARDDHDAANTSYFVNTVDMGLYSPFMETEAPNNGISRNASFPDYYYASLRGMNKKPTVFITYVDAARYANWLHNGKPTSARYRTCSIVNGTPTVVTLAGHGFVNGNEISFNCLDGGSFSTGTLSKNTKFIVAGATADTFQVKTTGNGDVTFNGTGTFYVKRFYDKATNLNSGSYTLSSNESTAPAKTAIARYWIPTENEWYKAAYYDPAKGGVGVPGYWAYPTRSDTMPSGVAADANGNGTYNPGGTVPGHYHSSYDISDFADRVDNLLADGNGTQVVYSPNAAPASIVVNVTGIPLSTVVDVRATATEVNYLSGVNPGTGVASRALVLNANKSISGISNLMADTGVFTSGSFGTSTSLDSASTLRVGGTGVSLSGHKHYYTNGVGFADIPNFCSGVADCVSTQLVVSTGLRADTVSSNLQLALSGQAATLHTFNSNGIIVRTGGSANNGTFAARSIASGANINITNGSAVDGNPTVALAPSVTGLTDLTVDQIKIDGTTISTTGNNDSITLAPNGTGDVNIDADTLRVGDSNADATITTNGTGDLILNTNAGANSSSITIADAANGDITLNTNGTGEVNINRVDIDAGNIDGTTIGAVSAAAGTFTAVTVDNLKLDDDIIYRSNTARIDITSTETVINNPGGDVDFRVEGDTNANLLFVDASTDRIGIGTSTPLNTLDVRGDVGVTGNLSVGGNLTVTGTTVIANVDIMRIKDPIILLGSGTTVPDATNDRGLSLALSASVTGFLGWSYSASEFIMLSSGVPGASSGTYSPGTYGAFRAGTINSTGSFNGMVVNATGALNTSAGATNGQINLNGSNGNFISWNTNGQGVPTTSVRSSGTKLVFFPDLAGGNVDTAIGTSDTGQTLWQSIKAGASSSFKWYGGATEIASLNGSNGNLAVTGTIDSRAGGGFIGYGGNITGLNASGLASGIVPTGRLSGTYNINVTGTAGSLVNALSFSTAGGGATASFDGSATRSISYNSVGAPSTTGDGASGNSWNIGILGNAATVTNGVYATGAQTISGIKTFENAPVFNSGLSLKNTAASSTSGFAVFDGDPTGGTARTLSYRSLSNIRSDLGASANTVSTLVLRDSSGDFLARNITITGVSGISTVTAGSITANNVWTSTSISGVNNTTYLLNFIIDGGTP
jgi:formylglycine-generating enzyme required for sulfatase activity